METRLLGGPADSASSRLVEQANIRAGLKRRYLLFGTISTFQVHVWLYFHIDVGVCVRSTFRHSLLLLWVVFWVELLSPLSSVAWCCLASFGLCSWWCYFSHVGRCCLASFFGCCCVFPILFSGAAFLWVGFPFSSVGWCCLASSFFGSWCFASHMMGWMLGCWVVGVLGGWVGCWGVRWFGGSVLRAGWGIGWLRGWGRLECSVGLESR